MPELPEVETMRRGLLPIVGSTIVLVEYPAIPYRPIVVYPSRESLADRVTGHTITAVDRIAKRVLVRLTSRDSVVMQPKMAGIAMLSDPPSDQHIRVVFHLRNVHGGPSLPSQFLYWDRRGLGTVCLWTPEEELKYLGPDSLGPDALLVDAKSFASRFRDCKKAVKVALLDQTLVAGIGNLYAAEILFAARVSPEARCCDLATSKWRSIHEHSQRILLKAIENEGSTLSDGTYRNAINGEGSYQNHHLVYDREGEHCTRCKKGTIVRIVQAQRSTFYCPKCQA
ncbi:MAG: bifunctional DNA-formamidopyrimidine glycosylase/DNA-(apurinic or apyrimidinic site) lyase [Pirellula sp.]|jgi:formamidopyrimidine-DNA glycosylase